MKTYSQVFFLALLALSTVIAHAQTYCNPTFTSCGSNNYINNVNVGGMNNITSGCAVWDYTGLTPMPSIIAGDTITMTVGVQGWDGIAIYIDLNNDGDMTDAGERLYSRYKATTPPTTYTNFTFTTPASTSPGNHRFRVMCGNGGSVSGSTDPCLSVAWGNFHDYTMQVVNTCPKDSNLTVSNVTTSSADLSWAARSGVAGYEYILNSDPSPPTGSGTLITSATYSASGLTSGQQYYFHIRTDCGAGTFSPWGSVGFVACNRPDAQINLSGAIIHCRGDVLTLSVPANASNSYQWYKNGNPLSGQTSNTLLASNFTNSSYTEFHATVESTVKDCIEASALAEVSTYTKPASPTIQVNRHVLTATSGFSSYEWYVDGVLIVGVTDSIHTASSNGLHHVVAIDSNGCSGISDSVAVLTVGKDELSNKYGLAIYPNPSAGLLFIEWGQIHNYNLTIMNSIGEIVYEKNINSEQKHKVQLQNMVPGVYFVKLKSEKQTISSKIIIQ